MALIRIESGDWLKNASIVGLNKVLNHKKKIGEKIELKDSYIEFDSAILENFEEAYFQTLFVEYGKRGSWHKLVSYSDDLKNLLKDDIVIEDIEKLNKIIEDIKKIITSNSYKSAYLLLEDGAWIEGKEKALNKLKVKKKDNPLDFKDHMEVQINLSLEIINWFNTDKVKRVVLAKNVMYDVIQPFWNNVSILLKTNNKSNMYELYKNDFINPVSDYIASDREKYKNACFTCDNKIKKLSKPEAFDLTWLVKTGVDMARKSSHFWNMNGDAYICPVCNLLYSCLPLGFKMFNNKGIFINSNQSLEKLIAANTTTLDYENNNFEALENLSYYNVLDSMGNLSVDNMDKEFDNIQVVKIDGNNGGRPYSFNILSPRIMRVLYFNKKRLESLLKIRVKITEKYYINLYNEVITRIHDGKNLFDLISKLLYMYLDDRKFNNIRAINNIFVINNYYLGGTRRGMKLDDISKFQSYGNELKNEYARKKSESKLSGITYRLANAIKTKDSGKFMDTIISAYMYIGKGIPKEISLALADADRLQNVGYAFIIGLQGEIINKKKEGDVSNE